MYLLGGVLQYTVTCCNTLQRGCPGATDFGQSVMWDFTNSKVIYIRLYRTQKKQRIVGTQDLCTGHWNKEQGCSLYFKYVWHRVGVSTKRLLTGKKVSVQGTKALFRECWLFVLTTLLPPSFGFMNNAKLATYKIFIVEQAGFWIQLPNHFSKRNHQSKYHHYIKLIERQLSTHCNILQHTATYRNTERPPEKRYYRSLRSKYTKKEPPPREGGIGFDHSMHGSHLASNVILQKRVLILLQQHCRTVNLLYCNNQHARRSLGIHRKTSKTCTYLTATTCTYSTATTCTYSTATTCTYSTATTCTYSTATTCTYLTATTCTYSTATTCTHSVHVNWSNRCMSSWCTQSFSWKSALWYACMYTHIYTYRYICINLCIHV